MYNELYWTLLRMNLKGVKLMIAKIIKLSREWDFYMNVEMNLTLLRINLKGVKFTFHFNDYGALFKVL